MLRTRKEKGNPIRALLVSLLSFVLIVSSALALIACSGGTSEGAGSERSERDASRPVIKLQIFAANSLERALGEVQALYTERYPSVTFKDTQFRGSGDLLAQLQGGASADILITASTATMDTAALQGFIDTTTRVDMFTNDLIIIRRTGSNIRLSDLSDINSEAITRIAIGDGAAVPAGAYANQSLFSVGLYSEASGRGGNYLEGLGAKVIFLSSPGSIAKTVSTGDVQIGFVYSSDLYRYEGIECAYVVPGNSHNTILYPGAVVAGSAYTDEAVKFLEFCLNNPTALRIWKEYGFVLPEPGLTAQHESTTQPREGSTFPEGSTAPWSFLYNMDYRPFWISLRTSLAALLFVFVLGLAAARLTLRVSHKVKDILDAIFTIPLVLPPTVIGFLLLVTFGNSTAFGRWLIDHGIAVVFSWPAAVIAATVVAFPLLYRTVRAAFEAQDPEMSDAARTLGWSESQIFFRLMLPLAWPSIAAGTILAFARAMGEFGATLFVAGNFAGVTQTMPLAIYFEWMGGRTDAAVFWVVVVILISFVVILAINLYARHAQKFRSGGRIEKEKAP